MCDGLYVSTSRFAQLFAVIGYTYGKGQGAVPEFALPDLRSRSIIGFDDMNNNTISSTLGVPGARAARTDNLTPNKGLASVGSAPTVTGEVDVTTGTTAVQYYHAMNYIIKT
jgi:microcystin-dependent protein